MWVVASFQWESSPIKQTSFHQVDPLSNFLIIIFFQQFQINHSYSKPVIACCCCSGKKKMQLPKAVWANMWVTILGHGWKGQRSSFFSPLKLGCQVRSLIRFCLILKHRLQMKHFWAVHPNVIVMNSPVSVYETATSPSVMHRLWSELK